ncbi:ABC transporter permease [Azotosporobacter soli]|uniref:ABC transporter permease n=1 Tax=Azotosporobacter soli TaxID=3055040 RepID=UPI0031FF22CD
MKKPITGIWHLYGIVIFFGVWYAVAAALQQPIIPSPWVVLENLAGIFFAKIALHSVYSLWRIVAGVVLSVLIGIPLGLGMGYFPSWDRALSPLVYLTYPVPKIAMLPVLMLLCGLGETSKILMIFLIIVFQVVIAVRDSVKGIPKETYYPLYSLGAGYAAILREILIPASLPKFLTSLRIAMATAISVLFFTETFGTQYGMGYFIMDAWMRVDYLEMYSGIVVLSSMGLVLFALLDELEKRCCAWQYK